MVITFPARLPRSWFIGLIAVCRQLAQFFELGLWQLNKNVKPNIRLTGPGKVASGVNVSGGHIQGRQSLCGRTGDSTCDHERAPTKRQIGTYLQGKTTLVCGLVAVSRTGSDISNGKIHIALSNRQCCSVREEFVPRGSGPGQMSTFGKNLIERLRPGWLMLNLKTKWETARSRPEEFEYTAMRKRGERTSRLSCASSLPGAVMAVSNHSFDRQRSIESVGRIVEDQDGVAGVGMEPA
jgi:hypothetical protein